MCPTQYGDVWLRADKKNLKRLYESIPLKRQLYSAMKKVWTPPPNLYQHLYFRGKFRVDIEDRHFYVNNHHSIIETSIFWLGLRGGWEKISISAWIELCRRSDVVLDIGANTGIYSLVAKAVNPRSRVYSFEPMRRVFAKLVANMRLNAFDVACEELALSNFDGEAIMHDLPNSAHTFGGTVNMNLYPPSFPTIPIVVKAKKLSTFIKERGLSKADLIKIDVESHEPEVLEGMAQYLERMKPTLIVEVWNDEIGERVEEIVRGKDYLFFSTDEARPFSREQHIRNPLPGRGYLNYLICHRHVADVLDLQGKR